MDAESFALDALHNSDSTCTCPASFMDVRAVPVFPNRLSLPTWIVFRKARKANTKIIKKIKPKKIPVLTTSGTETR